ncbi:MULTISPECIES: redoxin domain-containing protein [unclassified Spirosoma]|uniref:redoxin domain-containing protein n=1 Tax=unclassified Spirosoma TaxID=2621999 RepID=UPI0009652141|nr:MULTISPECIES: redoxin domain-containing protein [unclassified Spirosoma]MBN8822696.1 redoxin domain-containing protein [Spirosoma sp.]OJW79910.1 MAG: alkyl hydroperoxide reductase [Spirosoma sp. 48-14]
MTLEFENELGHIRSVTSALNRPKTARKSPLLTGDLAPFFSLTGAANDWRVSVFGQKLTEQATSIFDLVGTRPLVVSFYCPCWGRYAKPYLESLVRLHQRLLSEDAELVVFSNESPKVLARQIPDLDFRVAFDAESAVAQRFGVYSEDDPVWERISGISEEAFTPALYVIGPDRQIAYHFLDDNFDQSIDMDAIAQVVRTLSEAYIETH